MCIQFVGVAFGRVVVEESSLISESQLALPRLLDQQGRLRAMKGEQQFGRADGLSNRYTQWECLVSPRAAVLYAGLKGHQLLRTDRWWAGARLEDGRLTRNKALLRESLMLPWSSLNPNISVHKN